MNDTSSSPSDPPRLRREFVTLPLTRREQLGDEHHVLTFDAPLGFEARPGQFLMIRGQSWGNAPLLPRPMSYLTAGKAPSILVRVVGEGTRLLARAAPGQQFCLLGPLGNGWRPVADGRRLVLVAGGCGIAPLLFLARSLHGRAQQPLSLYGARSARDLVLADQLGEVSELLVVTEDGSRGRQGLVTDVLADVLGPDVQVYTCGPEAMMAKVAEACAARTVPCEVSLEAPMACGLGVCLGCAVPTTDGGFLYACNEGPCVDAARVDWSRCGQAHGGCACARSSQP